MTTLHPLKGLVVIDEVQRRPDLFPILRVLADRQVMPTRFLILGSASGELLRQTSESLASRMERIVINGFSLPELGAEAEQLRNTSTGRKKTGECGQHSPVYNQDLKKVHQKSTVIIFNL